LAIKDKDPSIIARSDAYPIADTLPPHIEQSEAYKSISTILDSLDALVYVADMETHEVLFFNKFGRSVWGEGSGKVCWQVLQKEQEQACDFCTNELLIDDTGKPTGVHVWEFQNTVDGHWYQCRDQAIKWIDGRLVRIEIATDISERKQMEEELHAAKEAAERLSHTDELTQLNNRRAFFIQGNQALQQVRRNQRPFSLVMFDIDHFKRVNDTYGHATGDLVLTILANTIRETIREMDIVGRIGGEEFALVLPDTDLNQALIITERLRCNIENTELAIQHPTNQQALKVTSSFGITSYPCVSIENADTANPDFSFLLALADEALFKAKNKGRNCIEHYCR
jgi:diguanylate cyclase (GGDEF)-like protein